MHEDERFTRLWTKAQPAVSGLIAAFVPDLHTAEDIVQEVAVTCLRKFHQYEADRSFLAWALGIAKREVLLLQRHRARSFLIYRSDLIDSIAEASEELAPELEFRTRALQECLELLDDRSRKLVQLRYEEALPHSDIAARAGLSVGNIRVTLSRIRSVLRHCIEKKLQPDVSTA